MLKHFTRFLKVLFVLVNLSPMAALSVSLLESGGLTQRELNNSPRGFTEAIKARTVGDVITIKVIENVESIKRSEIDIDSSFDQDARLKYALAMSMTSTLTPDANDTSNSSTELLLPILFDKAIDKDIGINNQEIFTTLVSALVVEIDPESSNMVIEGSRQILMEGETKSLYIRGIVNSKDIDANNEIPSYKLANAQVQIIGSGSLSKTRDSGIFQKILNKIF